MTASNVVVWMLVLVGVTSGNGTVSDENPLGGFKQVECGLLGSEFSKPESLDRLNACVKTNCSLESLGNATKPEILLAKIFKLMLEDVIDMDKFEECAAHVHANLSWEYVRVMHKYSQLSTGKNKHKCISHAELCTDNLKYMHPFGCFVKKHCDKAIADLGYAMLYAFQQISLEREQPLRCGKSDRFDLNPAVYEPGTDLRAVPILAQDVCARVHLPAPTLESDHHHHLPKSIYDRLVEKTRAHRV